MAVYDVIATAYLLVSVGLFIYLFVVVVKKRRTLSKNKDISGERLQHPPPLSHIRK
jgi:hypothetical protein